MGFLPILCTGEFFWEFLTFIIGRMDGWNGQCMDGCNDRHNAQGMDGLYGRCTDGAMTDIMHDVWTDCTDNAWTGALKGVMYDVLMDGDFAMFSSR